MIGQRFGRLTVIRLSYVEKSHKYWYCDCDCGKYIVVRTDSLQKGNTKSCGCFKKDRLEVSNSITHGMRYSPEYGIWNQIIQRCTNKNNSRYHSYGGRGIRVSKEWSESFENFILDMGKRPSDEHSIERKNNNGDYCKENCIWAKQEVQVNNRRSNNLITWKGETKNMTQWSKILGINYRTLLSRIKRNWRLDDAMTIGCLPYNPEKTTDVHLVNNPVFI